VVAILRGMQMPKRIIRKIVKPEEAPEVANRFRKAASKIIELAERLDRVARDLEPTWEGNSKERFFSTFWSTPGQIKSSAEILNQMAGEIEQITITIEIVQNY
jgi:WXG100 family type VII secretion target